MAFIRIKRVNLAINLVKTRPPNYTDKLISRDCLADLCEAHANHSIKVILLEAVAGAGKSTLLQQLYKHLEQDQQSIAWLSLDDSNNDPIVLLAGLASALQSQGTGIGSACLALLQAAAGIPASTILTTLFNEIFAYQKSITLFLDDIHLCEHEDSNGLLQELLENSPANLRLIMGGRTQANFNIIKLKARGQLKHFSSQDIRASHKDSQLFFKNTYNLNVDDDDLHTLVNRTDGWMNGLQIAALAMQQRENKKAYIQELNGSQKALSSYIDTDIFQKLPEDIQTFLVHSSVLEMLTPSLCDAMLEQKNSQAMLDQVIHLNLFIIPLDENHQWYRYHHLFSEFLLTKLKGYPAKQIHLLHERAYKWCLENEMYGEAVAHAINCKDWPSACDAIEECRLEFMITNRISSLQLWICQLPEDIINTRPILLITMGWYHAMVRQFSLAQEYLARVEGVLQNASFKNSLAVTLQNDLRALKGVISINRGDPAELFELSRSSDLVLVDNQDIFDSAYTSSAIYAHVFSGRFDKAHRLAIEMQMKQEGSNIVARVYSYIFRGWAYRQCGDFNSAFAQYGQARMAAKAMLADSPLDFPVPNALQMEMHYEWNELEKVRALSPILSELVKESSTIEAIICGYIYSARLAYLDKLPQQALQILAEGEALAKQEACHLALVNILAERVRLLISLDMSSAAHQSANDLYLACEQRRSEETHQWLDSDYLRDMTIIRLELYNQEIQQGIILASHHIEKAQQQGRHYPLVQLCLLKAVMLCKAGKEKHALKFTAEAIHYGASGSILRSFIDAPVEAHSLIAECLSLWPVQFSQLYQQVESTYLEQLKGCFAVAIGDNETENTLPENLEPLTLREQELLLHLSAGLKNKQLAQKLSLSENTIAWHLKNLYGKLGVSNRTSAVDVARKLHKIK
jgi:ATP/maltotriose-dependent transcriptional regulator MalT